jgi:hypothetical protein
MCASVCPSEALWYGTIDEFRENRTGSLLRDFMFGRQQVRTKVYTVVDDLAAGPIDVMRGQPRHGSTTRSRRAVAHDRPQTRTAAVAAPIWKRDFPYEAAAEEEVTRREFARYLVAGAGASRRQRRPRSVDPAAHHQRPANPAPSSTPPSVEVGGTHLFRYPTDADPAVLLRVSDTEVVAFSQKCTHLGCVVYYEADEHRWHCPCHEGQLRRRDRRRHLRTATAAARPHRRRDPRRRHDLGLGRSQEHEGLRTGRRSSSAVLIYVIILMAMQVFLVTVAVEAFLADEAGLAWATAMRVRRAVRRRRQLPALPPTVDTRWPTPRHHRSRRCSPATSRS